MGNEEQRREESISRSVPTEIRGRLIHLFKPHLGGLNGHTGRRLENLAGHNSLIGMLFIDV